MSSCQVQMFMHPLSPRLGHWARTTNRYFICFLWRNILKVRHDIHTTPEHHGSVRTWNDHDVHQGLVQNTRWSVCSKLFTSKHQQGWFWDLLAQVIPEPRFPIEMMVIVLKYIHLSSLRCSCEFLVYHSRATHGFTDRMSSFILTSCRIKSRRHSTFSHNIIPLICWMLCLHDIVTI